MAVLLTDTIASTKSMAAEANVAWALNALLARPAVQELVKTEELMVRLHEPHDGAPGWFVQLLGSEGELLGAAYGEDETDACFAAAMEMERAIKEHEGE